MRHTHQLLLASVAGFCVSSAHADFVNPAELVGNASPEGASSTTTFALFNHPGGMVSPQEYGLRLDSFTNSGIPITFSFEDTGGNSTVRLIVTEFMDGSISLNINGTISGNSADGGTSYGDFMLDLTYTVDATGNGWEDNNMSDGVALGGLTGLNTTMDSPLGNGDFLELSGKSDGSDAFRFLADGHRVFGNMDEWVGRGWVMGPNSTGAGFDDLLFTAQIVPLPPAALAGLGMLAGIGAYRRWRCHR